jgi:tetratricopeptide (TPR) repeat protein
MWHYARGVAHAGRKDLEAARAEADAIATIGQDGDIAALAAGGVPAADLLRLARHVIFARMAQAEGRIDQTIAEWEAASAIERTLPYMEPPFWYFPVDQSLGAALVEAGQFDRAEAIFNESLKRAPNNGWALFGLAEVQKARGDAAAAARTAAALDRAWIGDRKLLDLKRL